MTRLLIVSVALLVFGVGIWRAGWAWVARIDARRVVV